VILTYALSSQPITNCLPPVCRGKNPFQSRRDKSQKGNNRAAIEKGGDALSLHVLLNKANARWVEKHLATGGKWTQPFVVDAKNLASNGVDMDMYEKVSMLLVCMCMCVSAFVCVCACV